MAALRQPHRLHRGLQAQIEWTTGAVTAGRRAEMEAVRAGHAAAPRITLTSDEAVSPPDRAGVDPCAAGAAEDCARTSAEEVVGLRAEPAVAGERAAAADRRS
jgi:hypothetical protein